MMSTVFIIPCSQTRGQMPQQIRVPRENLSDCGGAPAPDLDVGVERGVLSAYACVIICLVAHEGGECLGQDEPPAREKVEEPLRPRRHPLPVLVERSLDLGVLLELLLDRVDDVPLQEEAQLRSELCVCLEEHCAQALRRRRELAILRDWGGGGQWRRRVQQRSGMTSGHAFGAAHFAKLVLGGLESNLGGGARPSTGRLERRDPRLCPAADALERCGENAGASHRRVVLDIPRGATAAPRAARAAKVVLAILHSLPCGSVAIEHRRAGRRGGNRDG